MLIGTRLNRLKPLHQTGMANWKPTHPYQEASLCRVLGPDIPVNLLPFSTMAVFSVSQVHMNYVVMCLRSIQAVVKHPLVVFYMVMVI